MFKNNNSYKRLRESTPLPTPPPTPPPSPESQRKNQEKEQKECNCKRSDNKQPEKNSSEKNKNLIDL